MLTLLLGTDNLAKNRHIKQAAGQRGAEVEVFGGDYSGVPALGSLFEPQLFGAPKVVVFDHLWKNFEPADLLANFADNPQVAVFIVEDSLDKRKKVNQDFLNDSRVTVVQLDAPLGPGAGAAWIASYAKEQGIEITPAAAQALARALVIDEDATLDVLRCGNELEKLKQFAGGQAITPEMVAELVQSAAGVDIFELLNAIASKNKQQALRLLQTYFETETADDKASAIKVAALLADQFRSLLIAVDSADRRLPDEAVLEMTGWKSGRLYVMRKLSHNFTAPQLRQALAKLRNLDQELKTGSMPPHVVLDLIIAGM